MLEPVIFSIERPALSKHSKVTSKSFRCWGSHVNRFKVVDAKYTVVERSYIFIDEVRPVQVHNPGAILWQVETIDIETIWRDLVACRFLIKEKTPQVRW